MKSEYLKPKVVKIKNQTALKYKGMSIPWPAKAIDVLDTQDGCMTQAVYVTRMGVFLSPEDYELAAKCVNLMIKGT